MTGGAYSKKYAAVPPGKTVSTPGAAALAAREAEKAPSPAEQRIKELNQNPALRDLNHPDNARLRKELREAVAAAATDEERDALANEPIYTLRSRFGIEDPKTKLPHPELRERWDAEAEAVGLASLANWASMLRSPATSTRSLSSAVSRTWAAPRARRTTRTSPRRSRASSATGRSRRSSSGIVGWGSRGERARAGSPQRVYYALVPSRRPAIAVVPLQQGRGADLAEVDFALKMLRHKLQRGGYIQALARVPIAGKGKRRQFEAARARRRLAKTLSRPQGLAHHHGGGALRAFSDGRT